MHSDGLTAAEILLVIILSVIAFGLLGVIVFKIITLHRRRHLIQLME